MSVRLKIVIAVLAIGLAAFAVLGDAFFQGLGLPPNSGRIVVAGVLGLVGIVWFIWTSISMQADASKPRKKRKP
jgi:hypothetical protein